jgi:hypothetical protein
VAGEEKYFSFSWMYNQPDSLTVEVDLGGAKIFTNFTTIQSNSTGSILFIFYPDTTMANTSYNFKISVNEAENF